MRLGGYANLPAIASSNPIMWLVVARTPLLDAPYWPGRRLLALFDAVAWPTAWIALATQLPQPVGIVGPMVIALAVLSVIGRVRRAAWQNHRYHFTTWQWGRVVAGLLLLGAVLKLALQA
jgi:hypothetical protein